MDIELDHRTKSVKAKHNFITSIVCHTNIFELSEWTVTKVKKKMHRPMYIMLIIS